MSIHTLYGTGRRAIGDWPTLRAALPAVTAAWADLTGFHITENLPAAAPIATHLWAWAPHHWLRVRLDHRHWWAALLCEVSATERSHPLWSVRDTMTDVRVDPIEHWPPGAGEVAQRRLAPADALSTHRMVQLVPLRPTTAVFLGTTDTLTSR
jgi:hypothetical protein